MANKIIKQPGLLQIISNAIVSTLESAFYWHGKNVARRPALFIITSVLVTALCSLGFLNFYAESRPEKLWIPQNSDYVKSVEWQREEFPSNTRMETVIYEAENVLTPRALQEMYVMYKKVSAITVQDIDGTIKNQTDLCFRVPALNPGALSDSQKSNPLTGNLQGNDMLSKDWSLILPDPIYCKIRDIIPKKCLELSILDIWGDDSKKIFSLTQEQVINDFNTAELSATYYFPLNFTELIGGVERNSTGHIIGAKAALHTWLMKVNTSAIVSQGTAAGIDSADVDKALYDWEAQFLTTFLNETNGPEDMKVYVSSERSFGEISSSTIMGDVLFLALGISILYIYVTIMLGKFDLVQQRGFLSVLGLFSVYMSVVISFGLCSAFSLPYGPVHNILPMLLLGLGVDDMFVMVQCWNNLPEEDRTNLLIKEQVGRTLKHSGVAITVTSLTDMMAFLIGSSTVLPALRSFCIYAAVGIIALYVLQSTFFVALFSLDQKRMADDRDGSFWFYKHKNYKPSKCADSDLCQSFFDKIYARILLSKPGKIAGIVLTVAMLGVSVWGVSSLRQEFNPVWFIPQSSYLFKFLTTAEYYYPRAGSRATIYMGTLDYPAELPKINSLTMKLLADPDISYVDSWYLPLAAYIEKRTGEDIIGKTLNETYFNSILGKFLYSPMGSKYQTHFHLRGNSTCGSPTPTIHASKFEYQHGIIEGRNEKINAMDRVKAMILEEEFSDIVAPIAMSYSSWETDKVIAHELIRNVTLALVAVLIMTLVLIANVLTSALVFLCVGFTLVEVMALMSWWGLTIDTVTCINLVLCIGLCVDYSAHIGLHFMQVTGTRNERVHRTLKEMAPAVFNGAFSTFLAFVLLAFSDSHVFISFFKIFFGVFIFGVYQGLVLLPIALSLVGPAPYSSADMIVVDAIEHKENNEELEYKVIETREDLDDKMDNSDIECNSNG